jgi:tetratricopeptide (TPR) repeat protein
MFPPHSQFFRLAACLAAAVLAFGCSDEAQKSQSLSKAQSYLEAGELEKAKIAYLSLLQKDPGNAEAIGELGRIWSEQGAPLRALPYLLKSRELQPQNVLLRNKLAAVFMSLGELAEARKEAMAILKVAPGDGEALMLLAESVRTPEERDAARQVIDTFPAADAAARHLADVPFLLQERDILGAEDAVARALAAEPKSVTALVASASLRMARNDADGAEQKFKEAADLAPVRSAQRLQYAEYVARRGRGDEARALVSEMCKQVPDYIPAWMLAARLANEAKQHDEALAALERVFGIDSDNYPARLMQAENYVAKNDFEKAIEVLEKLEAVHPRQPNVKYQLGRAHLQKGDFAKASEALKKAVTLNPDFAEASFMLAQIDLRSGRAEAVVPAMKRILERRPQLTRASIALADAYQALGRKAEALDVMKGVVNSVPDDAGHRLRFGQLLAEAGQSEAARAEFKKAMELAPGDLAGVSRMVDMDLAERKFADAAARVQAILDQTPDAAPAYFMMGRIHAVQQAWDEAEKALVKAIELDGDLDGAHDLLIQVQTGAGRLPQALAQAEAALVRNPQDIRALRHAAVLHSQKGDFAKAAEAYEKLLPLLPAPDPFVLNNLGTIYAVHLDRADRGFELARQARELRPSVAAALTAETKLQAASIADTLGWLLYQRGEYAQALALSQEAAGHLGDNDEVQYHLGMTAAAMGQTEIARKALALAVASPNEFAGKAEARQHLALLGGEGGAVAGSADIAALIAKSPTDPALQLRLAEAHEREQNPTGAATAYAAALGRNPALVVAARRLAELHAGPLNDPAKALEFAKTARQLAPNDPQVAGLLGGLVHATGDHAFAHDLLREAVRGGVRDAATLATLARAAYSLGQVEEARTALQDALAANPAPELSVEVTSFLALTAPVAPGQTPDAAAAEQALQRDPRNVPALMIRAEVQAAKQDPLAVKSYEEVLSVYPGFLPAQVQLALLLSREPASRDRAYELATQARKALPDDPLVAEVLGQLNYHRKDYSYAVQLLNEAARTRPPGAEALRCLGLAQVALGDKTAARETLTKAVAAGLPEAEAAEVAEALAGLQ